MKAIAGLSEQQDRDLASAPVFCFVGEEQCSVTAGCSPMRQSEPRVLEFARGSGPAAGSLRARDHGGGRAGQRPPRDANAHVPEGAQRGASHAWLQVGDLLVWRVWAEEHLAGQRWRLHQAGQVTSATERIISQG
jgi:hypothetical protein